MDNVINYIKSKGYDADITNIEKNGAMRRGISVKEKGSMIGSIYYLDNDGVNIEHVDDFFAPYIGDLAIKNHEDHKKYQPNLDTDWLDWNVIKDKIVLCVRPVPEIETDLYHYDFLDLQMYLRLIVDNDPGSIMTAAISSKLVDAWDIPKEDVVRQAAKNTQKHLKCMSIGETLGLPMLDDFSPIKMFTLTSDFGAFGAAAFCIQDYMYGVSERLGTDKIFIFPSSIHEVVVMPYDDDVDMSDMKKIIHEINLKFDPTEVLSTNIYIWDRGSISIAEDNE